MCYRNEKRRAAISILTKLCTPSNFQITAKIENGKRTEINNRVYSWVESNSFINDFSSKGLFRDAVDLLVSNNHIDILDNTENQYEIKLMAFRAGEIALRDDTYQDDISVYNSEKKYRDLKWIIPIVSVLLTAITIAYTFYKDGRNTTTINEQKLKIDNLQKEIEQIKINNKVPKP